MRSEVHTQAAEGTGAGSARSGGSAAAVLEARNVGVAFDGHQVLGGLDLELAAGELLAVQGPSGVGKSTLLHVLSGLIRPDEGEVLFKGARIDNLPDRRRCRIRLASFGFAFQFGELLPELTVRENVELPLRLLGSGKGAVRELAQDTLARFGIGELADRTLAQVSGGQLQRAAIARAVIHRPAVVFADEPTGALDEDTAAATLDVLIEEAKDRGIGVVLVTHDAAVAASCGRVVHLTGATAGAVSKVGG